MNEEYKRQFTDDLITILKNVIPESLPFEKIVSVCEDYANDVHVGVLEHDGVINTASAIIAFKVREFESLIDRYAAWRSIEIMLFSEIREAEDRLLESGSVSEEGWQRVRSNLKSTQDLRQNV